MKSTVRQVFALTTLAVAISFTVAYPVPGFAQNSATTQTELSAQTKTNAAARVTNPLGKALPCDELKQSIAEKLQSKNVKNYKLDVIDIAQEGGGKVVGRCDGGKHKIVYSKN